VRSILRLVFLLVLVLICLTAWVGIRGWLAKDHLQDSADLVQQLQTQLEQGSTSPARATLKKLQQETEDAARLTGDPVWRAAAHLPSGSNLTAVHAVSVAGHTVSTQALPQITDLAADVGALRGAATSLTPAQLLAAARRAKSPLASAKAGVAAARAQIDAVDPAGLAGPVRTGVEQFSSRLQTLQTELTSLIAADDAALKAGAALGT
jgi:hypothetical protein